MICVPYLDFLIKIAIRVENNFILYNLCTFKAVGDMEKGTRTHEYQVILICEPV